MNWRNQAKCANDPNVTLELFFPDQPKWNHSQRVWQYCEDCPVRIDCLETALELPYHQDAGWWGGLSLKDRNRIRRAQGTYFQR